jgi:hypothetical protein
MSCRLLLVTSDPQRDATRYVELLARRLRDFHVQVDGLSVGVRIGVFRFPHTRLQPFRGVSSAHFRVTPESARILVEYDVRLTGLAWSLVVSAVVVCTFLWSYSPTWWNVAGPFFVTAFAFCLNWLSAHLGVRRFLRRIGHEVTDLPGKTTR